jgi:hypothetical protein
LSWQYYHRDARHKNKETTHRGYKSLAGHQTL